MLTSVVATVARGPTNRRRAASMIVGHVEASLLTAAVDPDEAAREPILYPGDPLATYQARG